MANSKAGFSQEPRNFRKQLYICSPVFALPPQGGGCNTILVVLHRCPKSLISRGIGMCQLTVSVDQRDSDGKAIQIEFVI